MSSHCSFYDDSVLKSVALHFFFIQFSKQKQDIALEKTVVRVILRNHKNNNALLPQTPSQSSCMQVFVLFFTLLQALLYFTSLVHQTLSNIIQKQTNKKTNQFFPVFQQISQFYRACLHCKNPGYACTQKYIFSVFLISMNSLQIFCLLI